MHRLNGLYPVPTPLIYIVSPLFALWMTISRSPHGFCLSPPHNGISLPIFETNQSLAIVPEKEHVTAVLNSFNLSHKIIDERQILHRPWKTNIIQIIAMRWSLVVWMKYHLKILTIKWYDCQKPTENQSKHNPPNIFYILTSWE